MGGQASFDLPTSSRPSEQEPDPGFEKAMKRAGRMLARRPHSSHELRRKLSLGDDEVAEAVLDRLRELRLVDDVEFAQRWVRERAGRRGRRALVAELAGKGISREAAEAAIDAVEPDETGAAIALASRFVAKLSDHPLSRQAQRLEQMLLRRGYSHETAMEAVRKVLPPEGWD